MSENQCPKCGNPLAADALAGHCPRCLMHQGLASDSPGTGQETISQTLAPGPGAGPESVLTQLRTSLGPLQPVLLKEAAGETSLVVKPNTDAMPTKAEAGDRYQISGEIARGGMGAVLRGRDVDLGRDLAVKVLLEKFADRPEVARRFIEEAQIGGQLQHPGVVPIYDIGRFGDRPFFTMKLVKGQTLAAILGERTDAAEDRPRLLGIALQVSQAMAYAHAKGVIHRDLKPANIMVGAFGEVQVMDWGLAKVLGEGGVADEERASRAHQEPQDETTIRTARSTGSHGSFGTDTEAGSILGTPAYMPPEQASGDIAHLDRRADVFGLGAILCEILTGKPPYLGRSSEEVRRKAANGDLADAMARLDASGADEELITLTNQCLAPEPIDRPKDAQDVADALTSYLDGVQERLQTAERERAVAVVREAEQRKKRKVQLGLAAAVVGLLLGGGAFAFWRAEQAQAGRERDARNSEAVASLLGQAEAALKASDAATAAVVLESARKRSAEGGAETLSDRLKRIDADLAILHELDSVDQFRWTWYEGKFPEPAVVVTRTREALQQFGAHPGVVSVEAVAEKVSASVVRDRIMTALDRLLRLEKAAGIRETLRKVDADPYRDAVRDAVFADDREKLVDLARQDDALHQPAWFAEFLGDNGAIPVERRRQVLEAAAINRPGNLGLLMTLGNSYLAKEKGWSDERLRWYQAAIAIASSNVAAYINLGATLHDKKDYDAAMTCFRKALELEPKLAIAYVNLGKSLSGKGQLDEAITFLKKSVEFSPLDDAYHVSLADALVEMGQLNEAIASYRKAIELAPKDAGAHINLGKALKAKGQLDEAIAFTRKAIALDPKFALAHNNLGALLYDKGQMDEAIACSRKAIELDPQYAAAHYNLGNALYAKGQLDESIAYSRKAIELDPKLATAYTILGIALYHKGQLDESIACNRKAIELDPKLAMSHNNLACGLMETGDLVGAKGAIEESLRLDPQDVAARATRAEILLVGGRFSEAVPALERAVERLRQTMPAMAPTYEGLLPKARWLADQAETLKTLAPADGAAAREPAALDLAARAREQGRLALSARLAEVALTASPARANDLEAGYRHAAARTAAQAGTGSGQDAPAPDATTRAALRRLALQWLRADLALYAKQLPVARAQTQQSLEAWRQDPALAAIRDPEYLAKLPEDERKAWQALWADVEELLNRAKAD